MSKLTFEEFWAVVESVARQNHRLAYHPCCDTWSTMNAKRVKKNHKLTIKWGKLFESPHLCLEEKKKILHAKLIEEDLRIPLILNEPCLIKYKPSVAREAKKMVAQEIPISQPIFHRPGFIRYLELHSKPITLEGSILLQDANPTIKGAACQTDPQLDPEYFFGKIAEGYASSQ
jgi:hypothetical protein